MPFYMFMTVTIVACMQAAKRRLTYPKYVWIAYDWYPRGWWKSVEDCDIKQVQNFLHRVISLRRYPAADDSSAQTDAGIVRLSEN